VQPELLGRQPSAVTGKDDVVLVDDDWNRKAELPKMLRAIRRICFFG